MTMPRAQRVPLLSGPPAGRRAFTLVELLVATVILLILLVALVQATGLVAQIWSSNRGKVSSSESARAGFTLVNETLSRATLNTYNDYVNSTGDYRDPTKTTGPTSPELFVPTKFARTSELHFISGPASLLLPGAMTALNPGHAVFFQSPLGETSDPTLAKLNHTLNSIGFYIQYGTDNYGNVLPQWIIKAFPTSYRYRLMEVVQPTESFNLYSYTVSTGANYGAAYTSMIAWLTAFKLQAPPLPAGQPRPRTVAEDVLLLVLLPRLDPANEQTLATNIGVGYNRGTVLCPNYNYDSRAWQTSYPPATRGAAGTVPTMGTPLNNLINTMRNQLPPVVDVAMVCADRLSLNKLNLTSATPPAALQVPPNSFTNSAQFSADLAVYTQQLTTVHVKFHVFRASVEMHAARWSFN